MTLNFPNQSRSYDAMSQRVRFLGYDGMLAVPFFLEVAALWKQKPSGDSSEAGYLDAFDANRVSIHEVARKAYARGRKNVYVLTRSDFK